MKQAEQRKIKLKPIAVQMGPRLREGLFMISMALALFLLISFATYHSTDPGWSNTGVGNQVFNWGGKVGALLADLLLSLFGYMAYLLPLIIVFAAAISLCCAAELSSFKMGECLLKMLGFILIIVCGSAFIAIYIKHHFTALPSNSGGIFGDMVAAELITIFNKKGGTLLLFTGLLCGTTLFTGISWLGLVDALGRHLSESFILLARYLKKKLQFKTVTKVPKKGLLVSLQPKMFKEPKLIEVIAKPKAEGKPLPSKSDFVLSSGNLPPITLLDLPAHSEDNAFTSVNLEGLSHLVEERLGEFGVEAKVVAVHPGPIITRFELDLAPGLKASKISGLAKDIARSLSMSSVRVVEVIPGKSVVGLELPNEHREVVGLRDILESQRYLDARSPVSLALGKDIAGYPVVVDLAKMPHLLVAGTTGSGKSVSLNAMLLSMLFKSSPEQLRFIMIDPKMLELSVYEGIPHLLTPVITDMKDAQNALRWCVGEMDRRYKLMASLGVRNLAGYNQKISESLKSEAPLATPDWLQAIGHQPPFLQPLPMIVVVIDELADMMMVVGKKVEELVARIAQKARAAGIHLIVATQRPSVDVITGLIKANVPTRISFQVSSRIDSRTILDQQGAEQLLGNGDMLYLPPGTGVPVRIHGAFVSDDEVHRVVAAWQTYGKPNYLTQVTEESGAEGGGEELSDEPDPLYDEALRTVTESRRASISLIQRRLRIGYNRAARIMEEMEKLGVVSAMDSNGAREVLAPPPV